jgi:hypothetical protein
VLDRAQALLAQRYRVGSPVLTSPALTRDFLRLIEAIKAVASGGTYLYAPLVSAMRLWSPR